LHINEWINAWLTCCQNTTVLNKRE
jgi:hypothetical protein